MKTLKFYYKDCLKNGYSIGAYNFINLETLKAICEGCKRSKSPVIVAVSEGALEYIGKNYIRPLFDSAKKEYKIPIFLHLDHGKSFEICKQAVDLGFDSVMIDASSLSFEENIKLTKKVVNYAHKHNIYVEAELGVLAGIEDNIKAEKNIYTDPEKAKEFVEKTGCDTLAVAIGTSHGAYKFKDNPQIRIDILEQIEQKIPTTPLVLHGASSVPEDFVQIINENGGNLKGAKGITENILKKVSVEHHIYKINTDTDIRLCYMATLRQKLKEDPSNFDIRKINKVAMEEISKYVEYKNKKVFCNSGKI